MQADRAYAKQARASNGDLTVLAEAARDLTDLAERRAGRPDGDREPDEPGAETAEANANVSKQLRAGGNAQ
jgi:hypothetical protein